MGGGWRDLREEKSRRRRASGPQELPRAVPILLRDYLSGPGKAQDLAGRSMGPLVGTAFAAGSDP